ncbi:caspase domain-containing protein [Fusarium tricinctum]|uniref:Caspase domain-containing protein n=1 Tax=Fusarium tricinctum TaxID=61284 RepID=A0A8K0W6V8_9HYPO|nr:caspase domain-containing protein [Fusarium tricinctum]
MTNTKSALLIGCPVGSLHGVETDLNTMQSILEEHGFTCTKECPATRDSILLAWNDTIKQTNQGDAVVIYYSGHGGTVENRDGGKNVTTRQRLQYLVPTDFGETKENDWRGITDVELSQLLRRTTDKTKNVTLILDCCHAARMARFPGTVKTIDPEEYGEVSKHIEKMWSEGKFDARFHLERNPDVVTIVASAQTESAYEQLFGSVRMGVLTEALQKAMPRKNLQGAAPAQVSWRSVMLRVRERMKVTCPPQYPQIEGDDLLFTFSLTKADLHEAIAVSFDGDDVILDGGELHGLQEGDTYGLSPFNEESLSPSNEIAEVVVTTVGSLKSSARFEGISRPTQQQRDHGMKGFLKMHLGRLPVALQGCQASGTLHSSINGSRFLSIADPDERHPFATVQREAGRLRLISHEGPVSFFLGDWQLQGKEVNSGCVTECVNKLESLARSRHLVALAGESQSREISQQIDVELGCVRDGQCEPWSEETPAIEEGAKFYLKIRNTASPSVHVWVFDLCAESVTLLSSATPSGRELHHNDTYTFGKVDFTKKLVGTTTRWPDGTPKEQESIPEDIIVIVADNRIDLHGLETSSRKVRGGDKLREIINIISLERTRTLATETQEYQRFGVRRFSFKLIPKPVPEFEHKPVDQGIQGEGVEGLPIAAADLPTPESVEEWKNLPALLTHNTKSFIGSIVRTFQGVPPCVWVINQHIEEITVVVSRYRPTRLLAEAGVNASAAGGGLNFGTTTYQAPATRKTLIPQVLDRERSIAVFPVWTKRDDFAVISIFTGPEKNLYIENDRVLVGSTAYFRNKPDLIVEAYKKELPLS